MKNLKTTICLFFKWANIFVFNSDAIQILHHFDNQTNLNNIIPLQAMRVGEFIEIRHKKISPISILSTLGCLSLCHSLTL